MSALPFFHGYHKNFSKTKEKWKSKRRVSRRTISSSYFYVFKRPHIFIEWLQVDCRVILEFKVKVLIEINRFVAHKFHLPSPFSLH